MLGNIIVRHVDLHSVVERNAAISCPPRHSNKSLVDPRMGSDHLHHLHRGDDDGNEQIVSRKDPLAYLNALSCHVAYLRTLGVCQLRGGLPAVRYLDACVKQL